MIRSFVFGFLVGGVLSALVLASISFVAPRDSGVTPAVSPASEPASEGTAAPAPDATPAPAPDATPAPAPAPAPDATPAPAASPQTPVAPIPDAPAGAVKPATPAPDEAPATGTPAPKTDAIPAAPENATIAPAADTAPSKATPLAPAEPVAPAAQPEAVAPEVKTVIAPLAPAALDDKVETPLPDDVARAADDPAGLASIAPDLLPAQPARPVAPPKVRIGDVPAPVTGPDVGPAPTMIVQLDPVPPLPGSQSRLPQIGDEVPPPAIDAPPPPAAPEPRILTQDPPREDATTATLPPEPPLAGTTDGVVTGRLAQIGAATPADTADADPSAQPPLVRYARPFENPDGKPVFSIVLIDTGSADLDRKALADLPFPVSFALDPLDPATAANSAIYRAAGQEVVMLATGIPDGANASDLEVTFATLAEKMPEAVAVLDQPDAVFQDNRPLATQVVPILAAQGRGMVTWDQGLNAADQVARREGLPTAMAFRYLDGEGENTETVRRYLDRAAFRAAQDGRVVVIGQTRPETVEALIAWGLEGRSSSVALAPISAALVAN